MADVVGSQVLGDIKSVIIRGGGRGCVEGGGLVGRAVEGFGGGFKARFQVSFGLCGSGFRVYNHGCFGCGVWGVGFGVCNHRSLGFGVWGVGYGVWGLGFCNHRSFGFGV